MTRPTPHREPIRVVREHAGRRRPRPSPQSCATLEEVLDAVPNPVSLWDGELHNIYANRAAYQLWFGRNADEMPGLHSRELLGPELYALNAPHQKRCLEGEPQRFERDIRGPDGETRRALIEYHPFRRNGRVVGLITIITDVTDRVHAEQAAAASAAELAVHNERRRIEDRAHEGSLQALFAALLRLQHARNAARDDPALLDDVNAAVTFIGAAITDLRDITSARSQEGPRR